MEGWERSRGHVDSNHPKVWGVISTLIALKLRDAICKRPNPLMVQLCNVQHSGQKYCNSMTASNVPHMQHLPSPRRRRLVSAVIWTYKINKINRTAWGPAAGDTEISFSPVTGHVPRLVETSENSPEEALASTALRGGHVTLESQDRLAQRPACVSRLLTGLIESLGPWGN